MSSGGRRWSAQGIAKGKAAVEFSIELADKVQFNSPNIEFMYPRRPERTQPNLSICLDIINMLESQIENTKLD